MISQRFFHYTTGNHEIDDSHLAIITCLEEIDTVIKNKDFNNAIPLMDTAKDLLIKELAHENGQMQALNFPYKKFHIEDHNKILRDFEDLYKVITMLSNEEIKHTHYKIVEVSDLFYNHIDHYDIQFSNWINQTKNNK